MNHMIGSLWQKICTLAQKGHTEFIYYLEKMAVNGFPSQSSAVTLDCGLGGEIFLDGGCELEIHVFNSFSLIFLIARSLR